MPELPEVETIVRGIRPWIVGRCIKDVPHVSAVMLRADPRPFVAGLTGREVERLDRRGKWMFFRLSDRQTLVVHLGMSGRLTVEASERPTIRHTHLRLSLGDGGHELRFVDPRRFGELWLGDQAALRARFGPDRLGPEPSKISIAGLAERLAGTRRKIKAALLDQRTVAGIGNIYADEILFAAGIHPARQSDKLTQDEVHRLHGAMRAILRRAIRGRGTSLRDYVTWDGEPGGFQQRLCAYGRAKQPCTNCRTLLEGSRTVVVGRMSCWCPQCQPY